MDRNRKILLSLLGIVVFSAILAIIDISLKMKEREASLAIHKSMSGPGVGVVRIEGDIEMTGGNDVMARGGNAESIIKRLDDLGRDSRIKAIVVRINSSGGTVASVQEIYQKIWQLRDRNIPLIASMGDVAASGGYYIASACTVIYANYSSITGSIGVIAMSPNVTGLFEKYGIKMEIVKEGKYKDIFSNFRYMTQDERQLVQDMLKASYDKFLTDIAKGRNQKVSWIMPHADGRIMIGATALKHKLIDNIGTFEDAVRRARKMANLAENSAVYDEPKNRFEDIFLNFKSFFKLLSTHDIKHKSLKLYTGM